MMAHGGQQIEFPNALFNLLQASSLISTEVVRQASSKHRGPGWHTVGAPRELWPSGVHSHMGAPVLAICVPHNLP